MRILDAALFQIIRLVEHFYFVMEAEILDHL